MAERELALSYQRDSRAKRKAQLEELKKRPCHDCGGLFPPICMDFDHREPDNKLFCISARKYHVGWGALLAEIAKCDLVCSNCHRIRTAPLHEARYRPRGRPKQTNGQKTHCPRGHAYTEENTSVRVNKDGKHGRACKQCGTEKAQVTRDRRAARTAPVKALLGALVRCLPGRCGKGHLLRSRDSYVYVTPAGANARICRLCVREKDARRRRTGALSFC
jgi:hypothetical protein